MSGTGRPGRTRRRAGAGAVGCLVLALAGCAQGGGARAPVDLSQAAELRQEIERLRADLVEVRQLVETNRRAGVEHVDRGTREVRAEIEAVQQALEANTRHTFQAQVETLDAQRKRLDLVEQRASELALALRKVEDGVLGVSTQLARLESATPERVVARAEPAPPGPSAAPAPPPPATPAVAASPAAAPASPAPSSGSRRPAAVTVPAVEPAARPAVASVAPKTSPAAPPSARRLFDRAMQSWKKGEPGQAVLELEDLVRAHPGDALAGAAQFWIGEAYFVARDYERAALEYRKAVELAPQGKETPRALLRLGLALRAQRREPDARGTWEQLVRDFPKSEAAAEARRALRER